MDILGKERDRLQNQLDEAQALLKEAHEMLREAHDKFIATLDAAVTQAKPQAPPAPTKPGPSMFAQNRPRKRIEEE